MPSMLCKMLCHIIYIFAMLRYYECTVSYKTKAFFLYWQVEGY